MRGGKTGGVGAELLDGEVLESAQASAATSQAAAAVPPNKAALARMWSNSLIACRQRRLPRGPVRPVGEPELGHDELRRDVLAGA